MKTFITIGGFTGATIEVGPSVAHAIGPFATVGVVAVAAILTVTVVRFISAR